MSGDRVTLWLVTLCLLGGAGCGGGHPGAALLSKGRYQQVLRTVRSVDQRSAWIRACARWRRGDARETRKELLLGLAMDRRSATGHRLVGSVEAHLGFRGAALRHLQRSLELDPRQPAVRRAVARLLLRRALQRVGPGMGPHQKKEAAADVEQAMGVSPALQPKACAISAYIARSRPDSVAGQGATCPGPPPAALARATTAAISRPARCRVKQPTRLLDKIHREHLLVSCGGAQAALHLEQQGCLQEAGAIWSAMSAEAPADPRWYLMTARNLLARGEPARARQQLIHHLYLTRDRAGALLVQAELLLKMGYGKLAARRAVEAMAFIKGGARLAVARRLLDQCGEPGDPP